jgi:hypothetical protein
VPHQRRIRQQEERFGDQRAKRRHSQAQIVARIAGGTFYGGGGLVRHRASLTGSTGIRARRYAPDFMTPRVMTKDTKHHN